MKSRACAVLCLAAQLRQGMREGRPLTCCQLGPDLRLLLGLLAAEGPGLINVHAGILLLIILVQHGASLPVLPKQRLDVLLLGGCSPRLVPLLLLNLHHTTL